LNKQNSSRRAQVSDVIIANTCFKNRNLLKVELQERFTVDILYHAALSYRDLISA